MNTATDLYRRRQGQSPTACPPEPCVCSTCGMLECLCRPRFFPGQILTADDLNRLDGYIRGKNRLHNRQLHGWGVVNGLEVTCNPCGAGVAVGCGYALSPCGDDIVVCDAVSVDVCDLIKRCKDAENKWQQCAPLQRPSPQNCDAGEEEWILAIRYAEAPARGVKPLRPAPDCTAGCGCGGSNGKCGCGGACGGGKCSCGGAATAAKPRGAPVQCEPTVICEGFAFEVYRKPPDTTDPVGDNQNKSLFNPDSELSKRFQCCISLLITPLFPLPGALSFAGVQANPSGWYNWMNLARAQLKRYFGSHGSYNCELLTQFNNIPFPTAGTPANAGAIFLAVILLLVVWFDAVLSCFCSALLPPCPPPSSEVRVPLASIHVAGQPCRVVRICNWTVHRKIATTFPALQYWLSLLPFGAALRQVLEKICCFDLGGVLRPRDQAGAGNVAGQPGGLNATRANAATGAVGGGNDNANDNADVKQADAAYQQANTLLNPTLEQPQRISGGSELFLNALHRTNQTLEFSTLVESLMLPATQQGEQHLSAAETANLPQFLLANQFMRPIVAQALGPLMGMVMNFPGVFGQAGQASPATATGGENADMAAMKAELAELRAGVKQQAAEIESLKSAPRPEPRRSNRKSG